MAAPTLLVLAGDGIGPEITGATLATLRAVDDLYDLGLRIEEMDVGLSSLVNSGTTLPDEVSRRAREVDGIILGPLSTYQYPPREQGGLNPSAEFRTGLRLYANIRPSCPRPRPIDGAAAMDLVVVRENTEGFYASRAMHAGSGEFMPDPDTALAVRKITRKASRRIAVTAFELARTRRRKVTVVHKANVLKISDGLFLQSVREVGSRFHDVAVEEMLVDAAAALLVRDPARFDVVLTTNMFGDILSNEAAELSGGLGLSPSLNVGEVVAMAQASHGSAPDIAGQNKANPTGLILSVAMLLEWLGVSRDDAALKAAAHCLRGAVDLALDDPASRTVDLKGALGTDAFGQAVVARLERAMSRPAEYYMPIDNGFVIATC
jgi:3-isopropylmalate dehydrogenase